MTTGLLALVLAIVAVACGPMDRDESSGQRPGVEHPHVVLITSDTLRPDHLSLAGYSRATSPTIDEFSHKAWLFTEAVTLVPKTAPSFATMFTGWHPLEHGVRWNRGAIPEAAPILAEILKENGYRTVGFVNNPALHPGKGFGRGFDLYRIFARDTGPAGVNEGFLEWARAQPWERPTFAWIHYLDPHGPYTPYDDPFEGDALDSRRRDRRVPVDYQPLPGFNRNKIVGAIPAYQRLGNEDRVSVYIRKYDAEIRRVDRAVASIFSFLNENGYYDGSAIVFTSDHGESMGEHNYYLEHGWFAYDATLRIPLIIKEPGQTEGRLVEEQVSTLDLLPTLLTLAGIAPSAGGGRSKSGRGRNILEALPEARVAVVVNSSHYPRDFVGLRMRGLKYLRETGTGEEELYELDADPAEEVNRASEDPDRLRFAREQLDSLLQQMRDPPRDTKGEETLPPEYSEELRSLGYVP